LAETEDAGRTTVRGMYHLFLGNASFTLMLAVTAIIVGRILGPDGYGVYTVALIVPQFVFLGVRVGLDSAATRYAARLRSEGKEAEAASFVFAVSAFVVGLAAVFTVLLVAVSGPISSNMLGRPQIGAVVLPIAMVSIVGQVAYSVTSLGMMGLGKFGKAAVLQALQGLTKLVFSPLLVIIGFGVAGAVTGYTLSFLVSGLAGLAYVVVIGRRFPIRWAATLREGLTYGFPVYLSTLAAGFVPPAVNLILALSVSNSQIGGYALAGTFTTLIALFTYPISTALFPLFSRRVGDMATLGGVYETSVRFTALLVVPVTVYIMVFPGPLMVTFYGRAYSFGAVYLLLLASMSLFAGLGSLAWNALLNGMGHTKDALVVTFVGSVVSVAAAVALIVPLGVAGAVAGQLVGAGVSTVMGFWLVRKRIRARLSLLWTGRVYAAAVLAGAVTWPLSWLIVIPQVSVVVGAAVFIVVFIPILAILKALSAEDLEILRGFVSFSALITWSLEAAIGYYRLAARIRDSI
jgi:O-antigen/teichoic acid export membrane protein